MFNYYPEDFVNYDLFNKTFKDDSFSLFYNDNYYKDSLSFNYLILNSQEFKYQFQINQSGIEFEKPQNHDIKIDNELKNKKMVKPKTKSTDYKTFTQIIITKKKKEIIFEINKVKKSKKGRKRKNQAIIKDKTHTKYKKDNIIIKIKRNLYNHSLEFVNTLLKNSNNNKINNIRLRKNDNSIIIASKIEKNKYLFETPIKDILSTKLSSKYIHLNEDYNKDKINFIIKQNNKIINEFLNKTFKEILNLYREDKKENDNYKDFKRLNDDLLKFKKDNEDENYMNLYQKITKDFETVIAHIYPRRERKKTT